MPTRTSPELEPLEWTYGDTTWVLRHDSDGSVRWLEPDEQGRLMPPSADDSTAVLRDVLEPDQLPALVDAITDGTWPAADRYHAVVAWWRYLNGYHEVLTSYSAQAAIIRRQSAEVQQVITDWLARNKPSPTAGDDADPFAATSSDSGQATREGGVMRF